MATRPGFYEENDKVLKKNVSFEWASGLAVSQKKKNVIRLHESLGERCLEVSTKSDNQLGIALSAFNLKIGENTLENVFQSSKVFENGGPYLDLLDVNPRYAKRDERLKNSGALIGFQYDNHGWKLEPKTAFYDYIYCKAVKQCVKTENLEEIMQYKYFTDIEFNPNKSANTQAEAIVVVKILLKKFGEIPELNPEDFVKFHCMIW